MQITGSKSISPIRQPRMMGGGQQDQRLVFLYPIFFDNTLSKLQDDIRDFMIVDFMGQIKVSNVLNVTTAATQIGTVGKAPNSVNPAQEVRKSLHYSFDMPQPPTNPQADTTGYDAGRYQAQVHNFLRFIQNQIQYDPRYSKLRPMISSLVIEENLMVIPIILGTKMYLSNANALYWILMISMAYNIPLNSESNMNRIISLFRAIPDQNFIHLLFSRDERCRIAQYASVAIPECGTLGRGSFINRQVQRQGIIQRGMNSLGLNQRRAISEQPYDDRDAKKIGNKIRDDFEITGTTLRTAMNIDRWDVETNHLSQATNHVTHETIPIVQTRTQRRHFENAMASFSSYVSNTIIPILESLENIMGPTPTNINYQEMINDFNYNVIESMDEVYIHLASFVSNQLVELVGGPIDPNANPSATRMRNATERLSNIHNVCSSNNELTKQLKKIIIDDLDRYITLPVRFSGDDVGRFVDSVARSAAQLNSHSRTMENWIRSVLRETDQMDAYLRDFKQRFRNSVQQIIQGLYDQRIDNHPNKANIFGARYVNYATYICGCGAADVACLTHCIPRFRQTLEILENAISDIIYFFFIWNFLSYMCTYMNDVDIDIQIQRRDVLDFPNYCLVIPVNIFKFLYSIYTSSNFRTLINSENPQNEPALVDLGQEDIFVSSQNISRIIEIVNRRLQVPNLIVVDKNKEEIYYQFMYMSRPNKISLQVMRNYIQHQKDVLPGF